MGQGQAELAIQMLKECAHNGDWLCLKNLHLVVSWLPVLEKELNALQPQRYLLSLAHYRSLSQFYSYFITVKLEDNI